MNHLELAREIHTDNINAGWWTNLHTGESIIETRNRPEMLMLIVSELSEAAEALGADDKLPLYSGFVVEMADAAIRIYDLLGCEVCEGDAIGFRVDVAAGRWNHVYDRMGSLMVIVNHISRAMEGYRKGNRDKYIGGLCCALGEIYATADAFAYDDDDLFKVIHAKREYNRNRADHKPENRRQAGGKAF